MYEYLVTAQTPPLNSFFWDIQTHNKTRTNVLVSRDGVELKCVCDLCVFAYGNACTRACGRDMTGRLTRGAGPKLTD